MTADMEWVGELRKAFNKTDRERNHYDILIDVLYEMRCFVSMVDERPCMFESYDTVIDFPAVTKAMDVFGWEHATKAVTALRCCGFTPLAPVLATYIERQAAREGRETWS